MSFAGVRFIESLHAVAEPKAQPRTGDMVAMVEHLRRLGQIRKRPAAFEMNGVLVVHPEIAHSLRRRGFLGTPA